MKKFIVFFGSLTLCFSALCADSQSGSTCAMNLSYDIADKTEQLEKCLLECYGIDALSTAEIMQKFACLQGDNYAAVIDSFVQQSQLLNIYGNLPVNSDICTILPCSEYTSILFENEKIRVSWSVAEAGEELPPQVRPWQSMVVIVQPSDFTSKYGDGSSSEETWAVGAYLLPPSFNPRACKNVGSQACLGLVFEFKS